LDKWRYWRSDTPLSKELVSNHVGYEMSVKACFYSCATFVFYGSYVNCNVAMLNYDCKKPRIVTAASKQKQRGLGAATISGRVRGVAAAMSIRNSKGS
jgi:hypothetical protein